MTRHGNLPAHAGRTQASAVVPRQLPAAVAQFTGRVTELAGPVRPGPVAGYPG